MPDKKQLRTTLRQRRLALSPQQQLKATQLATQHACALPQWPGARRVAIYQAVDGEMGTENIAQRCHTEGKQVYLPVINTDMSMDFAQLRPGDPLVKNRVGICEPAAGAKRCQAARLDIIFIPVVAWDSCGNRLGMGGGYYDRMLEGLSGPLLAGLAHQVQEVDSIPQDSWDIPLQVIITDAGICHCQG